ncbi:MAG TPA: quinoprotein dehydrogenase-associated putative ABC transporter substrate-binding protein [Burkholderiales bacterium]
MIAAEDDAYVPPRALKVCDDPNNLPFSNDKGEGFENKIAEVLARRLNLPLESFHYPQRINVVRNTIRYKLPNQSEYRCDLLPGVPSDFTALATTKPYYRSTYVLVYKKGGKLDGISSGEQLLAMDAAKLKTLKIGVYDRTPPVEWFLKHKMIDQVVPFRLLNADPRQYPGKIIEDELLPGKLDAVVVWGPIGGYFAKRAGGSSLVVIPLKSEPGVRFDFGMAMGVRHGEKAWRDKLEQSLDASREDIDRILREYAVPLVDEKGVPIP